MSLIRVNNLTFNYDGDYEYIFENVFLNLDTDWKLGFIGRNGRGKTTFLKLLMGDYEHKGEIISNVNFEYFPYEIKDKSKKAIDIIKSRTENVEDWEIELELNKLKLKSRVLNTQFDKLSDGEQIKIMIASMFLKEYTFMLIDEPTNHLDMEGRKLLSQYLKEKKGFIVVTHDRQFLDNCIDHVLSINKSDIEIQKGNFTSFYENKYKREEYEKNKNKKLKKEIDEMKESAKQTGVWSAKVEKTKNGTKVGGLKPDRGRIGHKAAKMMKRSKVMEKRLNKKADEKSKLLKNIETTPNLKIKPLEFHSNTLIYLSDISIYYNNKEIVKDINFEINQKEAVAIEGKNGSGKTSILKLINDQQIKYKGAYVKKEGIKISYLKQNASYLDGNIEKFIQNNSLDGTLFKTILRKLDFKISSFTKDMSNYSEGQKKKVELAKSLSQSAHLYIWDEPLNYIDIYSRIQLENLLKEYKPTIIFVEHDRNFVDSIASKIVKI